MKNNRVWLIYIGDERNERRRNWLQDLIVSHDGVTTPVFTTERLWAMTMKSFDDALTMRDRLAANGYAPHIMAPGKR